MLLVIHDDWQMCSLASLTISPGTCSLEEKIDNHSTVHRLAARPVFIILMNNSLIGAMFKALLAKVTEVFFSVRPAFNTRKLFMF